MCVCVNSERQGRSLQLQLEQTTAPHPGTGSSSNNGGGGGRERPAGPTRQSRSRSQRRASPYHQQSRDSHLPSLDCYATCYDHARYYYDKYGACMIDSRDDRTICTPFSSSNSLLPYDYPLYGDPYVTGAQSSSSPREHSACAVHSSVIVRRRTETPWSSSCREAVVGRYGGDDGVGDEYVMVNGAGAGYTSVIVTRNDSPGLPAHV